MVQRLSLSVIRPPRTYTDFTYLKRESCSICAHGSWAASYERLTNLFVLSDSINLHPSVAISPALHRTRSVYRSFCTQCTVVLESLSTRNETAVQTQSCLFENVLLIVSFVSCSTYLLFRVFLTIADNVSSEAYIQRCEFEAHARQIWPLELS